MRVVVLPDAKQTTAPYYTQNKPVRFTYRNTGVDFVPNTFTITGKLALYSNLANATVVAAGDEIYIDPDVGAAVTLGQVAWSFSKTGVEENIRGYSNLCKKYSLLRQDEASIGTNLSSSMELRAPNQWQTQALAEGLQGRVLAADNAFVDFSHRLICGLNSAERPFSSDANGDLVMDILLQNNTLAMFGNDMTINAGYSIRDLQLEFEVIPSTGNNGPVRYTKHIFGGGDSLLANQTTATNTVSDPCIGFMSSATSLTNINTMTFNNLACAPPAGRPPVNSTSTDTFLSYGLERVYYSIGNVDTALTGFELQSREEIVGNALAITGSMQKYGTLVRRMRHPLNPDGYVWGYLWGQPMDLVSNSLTQYYECQAGAPNPTYRIFTHYLCVGSFMG